MIKLEGRSGKPIYINPRLIMMVDQASDINTETRQAIPLPGISVLLGINAQFPVKGSVEQVMAKMPGWFIPLKQAGDTVGLNPMWVTGLQQNVDQNGVAIIGKAVVSTTSGNLVFDGNMGEIATLLSKWNPPQLVSG